MAGRISVIVALLFFSAGCGSQSEPGMEYQRVLLARKGDTSVYCYSLLWALDANAEYISTNKDVCMGFNSTKDYCFGKGYPAIYYTFENDTLKVYFYGKQPTIPKYRPLNLVLTELDFDAANKFELYVKEKKISKVGRDSLFEIPCPITSRPFDLMNLKFKRSNNVSN